MKKLNVLYNILFACLAFLMWQGGDMRVLPLTVTPFFEEVSESVPSIDLQSDSLVILQSNRARSLKRSRRTDSNLLIEAAVIADKKRFPHNFFSFKSVWWFMSPAIERLSFYCVRLI